MLKPQIDWKTPDEMMNLLIREAPEKFYAILLVEREEAYTTIAVFGEKCRFWEDAPLSDFAAPEFKASKYTRLALVAIQDEG